MTLLNRNRLLAILAPVILGALSFFLVIGPGVLNPSNIAWLSGGGDTAQHYLGWAFFRSGPWTLPLGLNPQFGLEISSSIVFSDSIPLMAFLFKPFSLWLPEPFQYLGIWMLLCFVLQACFAWLLIGLFTNDWAMKLLGAALLVFAPPMLFRMVVHIPLASHFAVLAALYLVLRPSSNHRTVYWIVLLGVSILINFYIFAMALLLWIIDLVDRALFKHTVSPRGIIFEVPTVLITTGILFWQAGYLALESSSSSWGLGFYRMNVLSIFNPMGWSYLLNHLYVNSVAGEYEGFNYLGLGLITLLLITVFKIARHKQLFIKQCQHHRALCLGLLALTLFAISHQVGFGASNFSIALPDQLLSFAGTLRSSGRLFWPVWYVIILFCFFVVSRTFTRPLALGILFLALCFQVVDTSAKWWPRHQQLATYSGSQVPSPLKHEFWDQASNRYQNIVRRPLTENPPDWDILASYAAAHQMGTDSVYLARVDGRKVNLANQQFARILESGAWDTRSLYIINNTSILPVLSRIDPKRDLFARIDNQNVLAPGWLDCKACPPIAPELFLVNQVPRIKVGEQLVFSNARSKNDLILTKGWWTWPDSWGTWSSGQEAQINLLIPSKDSKKLTLLVRTLISPSHPFQRVKIQVNGRALSTVKLDQPEHNAIEIHIDAQMQKTGYLAIDLIFLDAAQPKTIGIGDDDRYLAIGIESARFN